MSQHGRLCETACCWRARRIAAPAPERLSPRRARRRGGRRTSTRASRAATTPTQETGRGRHVHQGQLRRAPVLPARSEEASRRLRGRPGTGPRRRYAPSSSTTTRRCGGATTRKTRTGSRGSGHSGSALRGRETCTTGSAMRTRLKVRSATRLPHPLPPILSLPSFPPQIPSPARQANDSKRSFMASATPSTGTTTEPPSPRRLLRGRGPDRPTRQNRQEQLAADRPYWRWEDVHSRVRRCLVRRHAGAVPPLTQLGR